MVWQWSRPKKMPVKTVTIGITMDVEFVRLLNAACGLSGLTPGSSKAYTERTRQLTPIEQLAAVAICEARGALPEQTHAAIMPEWRPHIWAAEELRSVEEE